MVRVSRANKGFTMGRRYLMVLGAALLLSGAGLGAAWGIETTAPNAFLIDADTGVVLLDKNADALMPPASMSKIMTVYMILERLRDGRLSLDDTFPVSEKAWRKGGSKMFVELGGRITVEDLLRGIIVQSGNDACIVVAEGLSGSEERFAEEMTAKAREIGLENSTFKNATGWPDEGHVMTARDLATLAALTIERFPEFYHFYSELDFTYSDIKQGNRNPLLYRDMGADGLKTGHTKASGYGLTSSVPRNGRRLILVVNGLDSAKARSNESERLLEWGFREFDNYALFRAGEMVDVARVWLGEAADVPLVIETDLILTLPRTSRPDMRVSITYEGPIPAPIEKGDRIATLVVSATDAETLKIPLVAGASVDQLGSFGRMSAAFEHLVWGTN
jgi:D-alanyl-D-alanine carboxypeptidase (penicillin-binding protein 5/6)